MLKVKATCTPGKQCFDCPYDDCIRSVRKITHEEVTMFKCAGLPVDRSRKNRKRRKTLPTETTIINSIPIIS